MYYGDNEIRQIMQDTLLEEKVHDIEIADLRPGRTFFYSCINYFGQEVKEFFEVAGWPFWHEGVMPGWMIRVRAPGAQADYCEYNRYLSDLGIVPYKDGKWNNKKLEIVELDVPTLEEV